MSPLFKLLQSVDTNFLFFITFCLALRKVFYQTPPLQAEHRLKMDHVHEQELYFKEEQCD